MNILLLASHAVAEYDDLRMFSDLGYDVFAPGGYETPSASGGEGIRPPLPDAPHHPELVALCQQQRERYGDPGPAIDWAKARLHPDLIDWADAIIVHHFPEVWIGTQWEAIRHKRVIWRTCGQSNPPLERYMRTFAGLQIVRYSPKEQPHFERHGHFAGQDALIRFGKYPDDYGPWTGTWTVGSDGKADIVRPDGPKIPQPFVANVTQHMMQRGDACGYGFWKAASEGLSAVPAGAGSEHIGGVGKLSYDMMRKYLAGARVYLYTGTKPASYTLGLIEAMMTGVPVVSIGAKAWAGDWDGADLFDGSAIVQRDDVDIYDDPRRVNVMLSALLDAPILAGARGEELREWAIDLFGIDTIGAQWREFLG